MDVTEFLIIGSIKKHTYVLEHDEHLYKIYLVEILRGILVVDTRRGKKKQEAEEGKKKKKKKQGV